MRRTRKQSLSIAATLLLALVPGKALAFHAGDVFDKPPGAGGGGGIFYTGAPSEHGWSCAACHTQAPGVIAVTLDAKTKSAQPASLFDDFR